MDHEIVKRKLRAKIGERADTLDLGDRILSCTALDSPGASAAVLFARAGRNFLKLILTPLITGGPEGYAVWRDIPVNGSEFLGMQFSVEYADDRANTNDTTIRLVVFDPDTGTLFFHDLSGEVVSTVRVGPGAHVEGVKAHDALIERVTVAGAGGGVVITAGEVAESGKGEGCGGS